jgi:hypothetical protein
LSSSQRKIIEPELVLEVYRRNEGNKRATARELGCDVATLRKNLALYGADRRPVVGGSTKPVKNNVLSLPEKGKVKRYICSAIQNNTKVFTAFVENLEAYADYLDDCQIMVARLTYNKSFFLNKQKPGTAKTSDVDQAWFDPRVTQYVVDDPETHGTCRWQLAPDLFFAAEMQIEVTAARPLSSLGTYTGTASTIFPHTKLAIESVPTVPGNPTKLMFTTGILTGRNYIAKKAGLKADFHHVNSACLVEVSDTGAWWVRHLVADRKGDFYDVANGTVTKVSNGEVTTGHRIEAISFGDTHVAEMPEDRVQRYWVGSKEQPAVIDCLKPKYQFHNDLFSMRSRSHHEMKSFEKMLTKYLAGDDKVENELQKTADFLCTVERQGCTTVVVSSNHDRHLEKYLDTVDYRADLPNVRWFLRAQLARVEAILAGQPWMCLEWALRQQGCPETVRFLNIDESFVICQRVNHPIEMSLHGDIGSNGSRGSTANLANAGSRVTKGHDHTLGARDGVWSAGTCAENQGYNKGGLTTWSVSHVITYLNGRRAGLVEREGKLWA